MLEDGLNTLRTTWHVLLSTSVVVLLFACSLQVPEDLQEQRLQVQRLLNVDWHAYEKYVEERTQPQAEELYRELRAECSQSFSALIGFIDNRDVFLSELTSEIEPTRLFISNTPLDDVQRFHLNDSAVLERLPLWRDAQVILPRVESLREMLGKMRGHFSQNIIIKDVEWSLSVEEGAPSTIIPSAATYINVTVVAQTDGQGKTSMWRSSVVCDLISVEKTAFSDWLQGNKDVAKLYAIETGSFSLLPSISGVGNALRDVPIGQLEDDLAKEIERAGPVHKSVSILGADIPGILLVLAAPLALAGLSYYFMRFAVYVQGLAQKDAEGLCGFAWLPLMPAGMRDASVVLLVLPLVAVVVMLVQTARFGLVPGYQWAVSVGMIVLIIGCGWRSLRALSVLRHRAVESAP